MSVCIACGAGAVISPQENVSRTIYNCRNCGTFVVSDLAAEAVKKNANMISAFLTSRVIAKKSDIVLISYDNANADKGYLQLTVKQILGLMPKNFTEKTNAILMNLAGLSTYEGEEIKINGLEQAGLFYVQEKNYAALSFMIKSLHKLDLIEINFYGSSFFPCGVMLSPKGWDQVVSLREGKAQGSKSGLLVLSGGDDTYLPDLRAAAVNAVSEPGYVLQESMLQKNIDFALINQIKQNQFCICDLGAKKGVAYFAAAFAWASGKLVLLTCHTSQKENLEINHLQIPVLFWSERAELEEQLCQMLMAVLP